MSLITTAKDGMLNALTITQISAHTAFPGATGINEVTGGTYARMAAVFGASTGAVRTMSPAVTFAIPAGTTVKWLGLWNSSTYLGYAPNASSPKEFIANATTEVFLCPAHGFTTNQTIVIYGDTMPTGLTEGTTYFAINVTTDTFQVAATSGGAPISITSIGGSALVVSAILEQAYPAAGSHIISGWTLGLPD